MHRPTLAATLALSALTPLTRAATFQGLGSLDPNNFDSAGFAVTDSQIVVGGTNIPGSGGAFIWDAAHGMQFLGTAFIPYGLTPDATKVVGTQYDPQSSSNVPVYWTQATGVVKLPSLRAGARGLYAATGISSDGNMIVGTTMGPADPTLSSSSRAVRWVNGVAQDLGSLYMPDGSGGSHGSDVSADGSVVVGSTLLPQDALPGPQDSAFRWTQATGMVSLGDLPGGNVQSQATAVSADGNVVVGTGNTATGTEAFRWTAATGMIALGRPTGAQNIAVRDVSGDGGLIVGSGYGTDSSSFHAAVWDPTHGWRDLASVLSTNFALDLTGWTLREALGISPDGHSIVGVATNPSGKSEAFLAHLPELTASPGDTNADGILNADDFASLDRGYAQGLHGWSNGDFDASGTVDAADYLTLDSAYLSTHPAAAPALLSQRQFQFGPGYVTELLTTIPEPSLLSSILYSLSSLSLLTRRRRP